MVGSVMRMSGLISGMDTQAMVKQLMRAESMRLDRLKQKQQLLEWTRDAYRGTASVLRDFQSTFLRSDSLNGILRSSTYNTNKATVVGTTAVTASATNSARQGSYEVVVEQVATRDLYRGGTGDFAKDFNLTDSAATFLGLTSADFNQYHPSDEANTGDAKYGIIEINGTKIAIEETDTIERVMSRINTSTAGVNVYFDRLRGTFGIESRNVGASQAITINQDALGFFNAIKLTDATNAFTAERVSTARDAKITFDGIEIESTSNRFDADGVMLTLTELAQGQTFTVQVGRDVTPVFDAITEFINSYNNMLTAINLQHTTARPRSNNYTFYEPLTDDQRDAMKESDITRWEEKAKTGMLHRDDILRRIHSQMREWMYSNVTMSDGSTIAVHQIGITTQTGDGNIGTLQIDEAKLKQALEDRPDAVQALFGKPQVGSSATRRDRDLGMKDQGLGMRLSFIIDNAVRLGGSIYEKAGLDAISEKDATIPKQLKEQAERIRQMTTWLAKREEYYYKMFSRMENAMQSANNQMDALLSSLG